MLRRSRVHATQKYGCYSQCALRWFFTILSQCSCNVVVLDGVGILQAKARQSFLGEDGGDARTQHV